MSDNSPIDPADIEMESTELSPITRRVVMTVPARQVKRFQKKIKKSGLDAGNASIQHKLIALCSETCIDRYGLKPIWGPMHDKDAPPAVLRPDKPFVVTIVIDDSPKVDWPEMSTLNVIRPVREITDEMVDAEMLEQRRNEGTRSELGAGEPLREGDEIVCSIAVSAADGEEPLYEQQVTLRLPAAGGTAVVFDIPAPELAAQLIGRSIGESVTITATAPESFFDPALQGLPVILNLTVNAAARIEPTSAEAIVEMYGSPSEAILRQQIRTALAGAIVADQKSVLLTQVVEQLLEAVDVPVPEYAISLMTQSVSANAAGQMQAKGVSEADIHRKLEEDSDRILQVATGLAKRRSVISLLRMHLNLQSNEEDLVAEIGRMAAQQGRRPEELRKELLASGQIQNVLQRVHEQAVVNTVLEHANVQDMPADEWVKRQEA